MSKTEFLTDLDKHLFSEGTHERVYEKLGAHVIKQNVKKALTLPYGLPMPKK